jgi:hypothetical protein
VTTEERAQGTPTSGAREPDLVIDGLGDLPRALRELEETT